MKKKILAGTDSHWVVVSRNYIEGVAQRHVFASRREAVHFVDHRVEGWDGWRLLQCSAWAEHHP